MLNKCSLADLCLENTEPVREEYQKDYLLANPNTLILKKWEREVSKTREITPGPAPHPAQFLALGILFSSGWPVILWLVRWIWASDRSWRSSRPTLCDLGSSQVCCQGNLDNPPPIWWLLFCSEFLECLTLRIRIGLFLPSTDLRTLVQLWTSSLRVDSCYLLKTLLITLLVP